MNRTPLDHRWTGKRNRRPKHILFATGFCAVLWLAAPNARAAAQQATPSGPPAAEKKAAAAPVRPASNEPDQKETIANAWKRITEATSSGRVRERAGALQALASAGDRPEAVRILENAMEDPRPEIRKAAAYALGQMQAHAAIPRLRQALDDQAPAVRVAAARALWVMHDFSGSDLLIRIVERRAPAEEAKLRQEWHEALHRVDNPSGVFLLALQQGIGFLPGPSFLAIPLFRELTKDKAAPGRATAATLLGQEHAEAAVEALELALVDPEPVVRAAAAVALGKSGRPEEIVQIGPLLHDHKPAVRIAAAVAIARLSPAGSGPAGGTGLHP